MKTSDKYYEQVIMELEKLLIKLKTKEWVSESKNEMNKSRIVSLPKFVVNLKEARWITTKFYEKVEENIFSIKLDVKKSPHSIEMEATLEIASDAWPYVSSAVFFLLGTIKDLFLRKLKKRSRSKKRSKKRKIKS